VHDLDDYPVAPRSDEELKTIADQIRVRLGMSQAAGIRLEQWRRKPRGRPELRFVRAYIDCQRSVTPQQTEEAKVEKARRARILWKTLERIADEDPDTYRLCSQRTYRIAWSEFERMTECGWFIQGQRAVAWMAIRS
jgi:hypothetical protein